MLSKNRNIIKKKSIIRCQNIFLPFKNSRKDQNKHECKQLLSIQVIDLKQALKCSSQKKIKHRLLSRHYSQNNFNTNSFEIVSSHKNSLKKELSQNKARSKTYAQLKKIKNLNSKRQQSKKYQHRSVSVKTPKIDKSKSKEREQTKEIDNCIRNFLYQHNDQQQIKILQKTSESQNKQFVKSNVFFMKVKPHSKSKKKQEFEVEGYFQKSNLLKKLQQQRRKHTKEQQQLKIWNQIPSSDVNNQKIGYKYLYMLKTKFNGDKSPVRNKNRENSKVIIQNMQTLSQQQNNNSNYVIKVNKRYSQRDKQQYVTSQEQNSSVSTLKTQREQKIIGEYLKNILSNNNKTNANQRRKIFHQQMQTQFRKTQNQAAKSKRTNKNICIEQQIFNILSTLPQKKKSIILEDSDSQKMLFKTENPKYMRQQALSDCLNLDIKVNCLFWSKKFSSKGNYLILLKKIVVTPFKKQSPGFFIDFCLQIQGQQVVRRVQWEIPTKKQKPQRLNFSIRGAQGAQRFQTKSCLKSKRKNYQPWQRKIKNIFCKIFAGSKGRTLLQSSIIENNKKLGFKNLVHIPIRQKKKVTIMGEKLGDVRIEQCVAGQGHQAGNGQLDKEYLIDIVRFIQDFTQMNRDYTGYSLYGMEPKYAFYRSQAQCFEVNVSNQKPFEQVLLEGLMRQHLGKTGTDQEQIPVERCTIKSFSMSKSQLSKKHFYCMLKLADNFYMAKFMITADFQTHSSYVEDMVSLFLMSNFSSNAVCQNYDDIKKIINNQEQIFKGYYKDIQLLKKRINIQSKILPWKNKRCKKIQYSDYNNELKETLRTNFSGFERYTNIFLQKYAQQISEKALANNKQTFHNNQVRKKDDYGDEEESKGFVKAHNRNDSENKQTYNYWPNSNFVFTDPCIANFFVYHQSFDYGYHLHDKRFIQGHCDGVYYTIQRIKTKIQLEQSQQIQKKTSKNVRFQLDQKRIGQSSDSKCEGYDHNITPTYIVRVWEYPENYAFILDNQFEIQQFLILHIPELTSPLTCQFYKKAFIQRHRKKIRNSKKINQAKKQNYFIGQDIQQKNKHQEIKAHNKLFPYIGGFDDDIVNVKKSVNFQLVKDKNIKVHVRMINNYLLMQFIQLKSEKVWKFYCPITTYHEINRIFNKKKIGRIDQDQHQETIENSKNRKICNTKKRIQRNSMVKNFEDSFKQVRNPFALGSKFRNSAKKFDLIKQKNQSQNDQLSFLVNFSGSKQIQYTQQFLNLLRKQKKIVYSSFIIGQSSIQQKSNQNLIGLASERGMTLNSINDIQSKHSIQSYRNNQGLTKFQNFDKQLNKIKKFQCFHGSQNLSLSFQNVEKHISNAYIGKIYQVFHKRTIKICHGVFVILVIYKVINYGLYQLKFYFSKARKMYFSPYLIEDFQLNIDYEIDRLTDFLRFNFFKRLVEQEKQKRHRRCQQQFSHMVGFTYEISSNLRQKKSIRFNSNENIKTGNSTIGQYNFMFQDSNFGTSLIKKTKVVSKVKNVQRIAPSRSGRHSSFKNANKNLLNFSKIIRSPSLRFNEQLLLNQECISQYFVSPKGNSYFIRISYTPTKCNENFNNFPLQKQEVCIELYRQQMFTYLHYFVSINTIITQTVRQRKLRKRLSDQRADQIIQTREQDIFNLVPSTAQNDSFIGMKKITPNDWRYLLYKIKLKICKGTKHQKMKQIARILKKMSDRKPEKKDWIQALKSISIMKRETIKIQASSQYCLTVAKNLAPRISYQQTFSRRQGENYSIYLQNRETQQIQLIQQWNGSFSSRVPLNKMNSRLFRRMCKQVKKSYCDRIIDSEWDSQRSQMDEQKLRQNIYDLFGNLINNDFSSESSNESL